MGIEAREDVLRGGGLGLARKVNNAHSSAAYTCHRDGTLLLLLLHVLFLRRTKEEKPDRGQGSESSDCRELGGKDKEERACLPVDARVAPWQLFWAKSCLSSFSVKLAGKFVTYSLDALAMPPLLPGEGCEQR